MINEMGFVAQNMREPENEVMGLNGRNRVNFDNGLENLISPLGQGVLVGLIRNDIMEREEGFESPISYFGEDDNIKDGA